MNHLDPTRWLVISINIKIVIKHKIPEWAISYLGFRPTISFPEAKVTKDHGVSAQRVNNLKTQGRFIIAKVLKFTSVPN